MDLVSLLDCIADLQWALGFAPLRHGEPDVEELLEHLPCGGCAIDVGANRGLYSVPFTRRVGAAGRVLAVEPCHENLRTLELSKRVGRLDRLSLHACALGRQDGEAWLAIPRTGRRRRRTAFSRVVERPLEETAFEHRRVLLRSLDSFVAEHDLPRLDVLKVDVEGQEIAVLQGGRETLLRLRPVLLLEAEDARLRNAGTSLRELLSLLAELGYVTRRLHGRAVGEASPNMLALPGPRRP